MDRKYCIYSDTEVDVNETNPEHILPLSLGGCNSFCILVEKAINSKLGSAIDGKLVKDFFIASIRKSKRYFGHSKAPFKVTWNKSSFKDGKPIIVTLSDDGISVFDPVKRIMLTEKEFRGEPLRSNFIMDLNIRSLFVAKTALSAGYFVYGDTFRCYADHDSLRRYIQWGLDRKDKETIRGLPLRFVDPFAITESKDKGLKGVFETICKAIDDSCIIFMLCDSSIIASVGIGGEYIGSISFNAKAENFPNDGNFRLGHVIGIQKKTIKRSSFYDVTAELYSTLKKYDNSEET